MNLELANNQLKTKSKPVRKILSFFYNTVEPHKTGSKRPAAPKTLKAPSLSYVGLCEKNGRFRYITKGKRSYLIVNIEDSDKILIGLREDDDEAWVKRVGRKAEK